MTPAFVAELTPYRDAEGWAGIRVRYTADVPTVATGEPVLRLPSVYASVPGAPYKTADIVISDAAGPLALTELPLQEDPMVSYRTWAADRDTVGAITVEVPGPVRQVEHRTPVGPLVDLRREPLGVFGGTVSFIPVPIDTETEYAFSLTWHLEPGVTAVSSYGTGDIERHWTGAIRTFEYCLVGAGTPRISPEGGGDFALHSYSDVPFDADELAQYLQEIHGVMAPFFEDPEPRYHVLVRRNPDRGTGGTSYPSSFAFGYSPVEETDEVELRTLLAHEMVHNWPRLDEDWHVSAWYSEGAAEFYSLALPLRAGILKPEDAAAQLTEMYHRYDSNPRRHLSFADAADLVWKDLRAQTLPYGRGIQYLVLVDAQLRAATNGAQSLDDIVLDLLRAQRRGEKATTAGWLSRVAEVLGDVGIREYHDMVDGKPLPRPTQPFQGLVRPVAASAPEHDLGFDIASFQTEPRRIQGLDPESAAARAGLLEGDLLVTRRFSSSSAIDGSTPLELTIEREGTEQVIRYEPRGREIPTTDWTA